MYGGWVMGHKKGGWEDGQGPFFDRPGRPSVHLAYTNNHDPTAVPSVTGLTWICFTPGADSTARVRRRSRAKEP